MLLIFFLAFSKNDIRATLFFQLNIHNTKQDFHFHHKLLRSHNSADQYSLFDKVLEAARNCGKLVVFVSNEVGGGIVPDNLMAREYRDLAGWVNQKVAAACDKVFYCVAGQAVDVKKLAFKFDEEE